MNMLQKSKHRLLQPLPEFEQQGFTVKGHSENFWRFFPALVSYCCDIPETKDMLAVLHGAAVTRPRCAVRSQLGIANFFDAVSLET